MTIGSTETTVVNAALGLLGEEPLTSYADDETDKARKVRAIYPTARNTVLSAKPWNALIRRARLGADETAPAWGWAYRFPLPADLLFLVRDIHIGDVPLDRTQWMKEGLYILANEAGPVDIRYVALVENPSEWGGLVEQVVIHYTASLLARPMTGDENLAARLHREFTKLAGAAAAQNSRENYNSNLIFYNGWESARRMTGAPTYDPRRGGAY